MENEPMLPTSILPTTVLTGLVLTVVFAVAEALT